MERFEDIQYSLNTRIPKEQVFNIIDERLKPIRSMFKEDQQMDMDMFHLIFTQSNELIYVVDCRTKEEYDECHISGSRTYVFHKLTIISHRKTIVVGMIGEDFQFAHSSILELVNALPRLLRKN